MVCCCPTVSCLLLVVAIALVLYYLTVDEEQDNLFSALNPDAPVFPPIPTRDDPLVQEFLAKQQQRHRSQDADGLNLNLNTNSNSNNSTAAPAPPIVIIGAGVAGVFAAASLEHMGITNYLLLEASDRIGGRLRDTTGAVPSVLSFAKQQGDDANYNYNDSNNGTATTSNETKGFSSLLFLNGDISLDLGAEWIHDSDGQRAVKDMLDFSGGERHEEEEGDGDGDGIGDDRYPDTNSSLLEASNFIAYNPTMHFVRRKFAVFQWIYQETKWNRSTWWQYLNECLVESSSLSSSTLPSSSTPPSTVNATAANNNSNNNNGTGTFVLKDKIRLNAPVTKIAYTNNNGSSHNDSSIITLDVAGGTERIVASKVICTIPLAVLKTKITQTDVNNPNNNNNNNNTKDTTTQGSSSPSSPALFFQPPLSESKAEAIEKVRMPPGYRILFEMKTKFYPDLTMLDTLWSALWSGRMDQGDLTTIYDPLYGKEQQEPQQQQHNVLAFVAIGPHHAALSADGTSTEDDLVRDALQKIDKVFDGKGTTNYLAHVIQDWTSELYIRGAYTFASNGADGVTQDDRVALGASEYDGNLIFAGEHTSINFYSLVPGAAMEGRRAAVEAVTGNRSS